MSKQSRRPIRAARRDPDIVRSYRVHRITAEERAALSPMERKVYDYMASKAEVDYRAIVTRSTREAL